MTTFHIAYAGSTPDRDVEAADYTHEEEFFVFWRDSRMGSVQGKPILTGKVLTIRADQVKSIEDKD